MSEDILGIKLELDHITGIKNVGSAKASAILLLAPTLGDLLNIEAKDLSKKVKGLSYASAKSVLDWAELEWDRLNSEDDQIDEFDKEDIIHDEEVLEGEENKNSLDPNEGPISEDGLIIDDSFKGKKSKKSEGKVIEIKNLIDRTLVVRKN